MVDDDTVLGTRAAGWRCSPRHETGEVAYRRLGHVTVLIQERALRTRLRQAHGPDECCRGMLCSGNHFSGDVLYAGSRLIEPRSTVAAVRTAASGLVLYPIRHTRYVAGRSRLDGLHTPHFIKGIPNTESTDLLLFQLTPSSRSVSADVIARENKSIAFNVET